MRSGTEFLYFTAEQTPISFNSDISSGLDEGEVKRRRRKTGKNLIWERERVSVKKVILKNLSDIPVLLMLAAAFIVSFFGGYPSLIAICAACFVSFAVRISIELYCRSRVSANSEVYPTARVIRDGKRKTVMSYDLVPGDIVLLSAADTVCADMRVLQSEELTVSEKGVTENIGAVRKDSSPLVRTGSPIPNEKKTNMLFASSQVLSGNGTAIVLSCGMLTEKCKKDGVQIIRQPKESPYVTSARKNSVLIFALLLLTSLIYTAVGIFTLSNQYGIEDIIINSLAFAASGCGTVYLTAAYLCSVHTQNKFEKYGMILRNPGSEKRIADTDYVVIQDVGALRSGHISICEICTSCKTYLPSAMENHRSEADELVRLIALSSGRMSAMPGLRGAIEEESDPIPKLTEEYGRVFNTDIGKLTEGCSVAGFVPRKSGNLCNTVLYTENGEYYSASVGDIDSILSYCTKIRVHGEDRYINEYNRAYLIECARANEEKGKRVIAVSMRRSPYNNMSKLSVLQSSMVFMGYICISEPPAQRGLDMIRSMNSVGVSAVVFASDSLDASLMTDTGLFTRWNIKKTPELGKEASNLLIDLSGISDEGKRRGAVGEFIRRLGKNTAAVAGCDRELFAIADARVKIAVKGMGKDEKLRSAADIICAGSLASEDTALEESFEICRKIPGKLMYVRRYLAVSQSARFLLLILILFKIPMPLPWIYLIWGLLFDTFVSFFAIYARKKQKI